MKPRITKKQRELARLIRGAWLLRRDDKSFSLFLEEIGFQLMPVSIKNVAVGKTFVVKWDESASDRRSNMADYEARQYRRAKPRKKRWLARTILDCPGLLVQERIPNVCDGECGCMDRGSRVRRIARRLRILDGTGHNHGFRKDGTLVFFDTDSHG